LNRSRLAKVSVAAGTLLCLVGVLAPGEQQAGAASTSHLTVITLGGDYFHNYDFSSENAVGTNVDWPISVFFIGNATVDKAKSSMESWSNQFDGQSLNKKHLSMRDSSANSYSWDADGGKKSPSCPGSGNSSPHYRVYGIGSSERLYNTTLGYWVPASTHRDYNECALSGTRYAQTEQTEDLLISEVDENTAVQPDYWNLYNAEPLRDEGNHRWENGGTASTVRIP
jgi:hypothetical protein